MNVFVVVNFRTVERASADGADAVEFDGVTGVFLACEDAILACAGNPLASVREVPIGGARWEALRAEARDVRQWCDNVRTRILDTFQ